MPVSLARSMKAANSSRFGQATRAKRSKRFKRSLNSFGLSEGAIRSSLSEPNETNTFTKRSCEHYLCSQSYLQLLRTSCSALASLQPACFTCCLGFNSRRHLRRPNLSRPLSKQMLGRRRERTTRIAAASECMYPCKHLQLRPERQQNAGMGRTASASMRVEHALIMAASACGLFTDVADMSQIAVYCGRLVGVPGEDTARTS